MGAEPAFQVKGDLANVDDLKKAIKVEAWSSIQASKIDIYSQKASGCRCRSWDDERWVPEAKMSPSLRNTEEADCCGFVLPDDA